MQKILIDEIRIDGFRGLKDFKMSLSETTVLTGMNNVGKTSVLKALQLLFGNSSFLSTEDLHIDKNGKSNCIIVDAKIVAIDNAGKRIPNFSDVWEIAFGADNIKWMLKNTPMCLCVLNTLFKHFRIHLIGICKS